jgi:hypothetical protein
VTTRTRRTLFISFLVLALTLPAETILLKALQSPNDITAVQGWVADLDSAELTSAANQIQSYPFLYRKEIMRALTPDARSSVWRNHIATYIRQHPELGSDAVNALNAAIAVATPHALSADATKTEVAASVAVGEQISTLLGRDTAKYLLYYLGPVDGTFASREPLTMKLASFVRSHFVVLAESCDCAMYFGCDIWGGECTQSTWCDSNSAWPACGWLFNSTCDALCR